MKVLKAFYRYIVIKVIRPYIYHECIGWGKIGRLTCKSWLWTDAEPLWIVGKLHGYWMYLDISTWEDRTAFLLGRWYDLPTQLILFSYLKSGDKVIDVGANKGMFSLLSSKLIGASGKVFAFEPNPTPRTHLEKSIEKNNIGNIQLYKVGLSNKDDTLTLNVPHNHSGAATFGAHLNDNEEGYEVNCPVKVGDDVLVDVIPSLIKIDVEGFEPYVLEGLEKTIKKSTPIILTEINASFLLNSNSSINSISNIFTSFGYVGFRIGLKKKIGRYKLSLIKLDAKENIPDCDVLWAHNKCTRHTDFINEITLQHKDFSIQDHLIKN